MKRGRETVGNQLNSRVNRNGSDEVEKKDKVQCDGEGVFLGPVTKERRVTVTAEVSGDATERSLVDSQRGLLANSSLASLHVGIKEAGMTMAGREAAHRIYEESGENAGTRKRKASPPPSERKLKLGTVGYTAFGSMSLATVERGMGREGGVGSVAQKRRRSKRSSITARYVDGEGAGASDGKRQRLHGSYTRGGPADNSTPLEWQKMAIELKRWRFHEDRTADKSSVPTTHGFSSFTGGDSISVHEGMASYRHPSLPPTDGLQFAGLSGRNTNESSTSTTPSLGTTTTTVPSTSLLSTQSSPPLLVKLTESSDWRDPKLPSDARSLPVLVKGSGLDGDQKSGTSETVLNRTDQIPTDILQPFVQSSSSRFDNGTLTENKKLSEEGSHVGTNSTALSRIAPAPSASSAAVSPSPAHAPSSIFVSTSPSTSPIIGKPPPSPLSTTSSAGGGAVGANRRRSGSISSPSSSHSSTIGIAFKERWETLPPATLEAEKSQTQAPVHHGSRHTRSNSRTRIALDLGSALERAQGESALDGAVGGQGFVSTGYVKGTDSGSHHTYFEGLHTPDSHTSIPNVLPTPTSTSPWQKDAGILQNAPFLSSLSGQSEKLSWTPAPVTDTNSTTSSARPAMIPQNISQNVPATSTAPMATASNALASNTTPSLGSAVSGVFNPFSALPSTESSTNPNSSGGSPFPIITAASVQQPLPTFAFNSNYSSPLPSDIGTVKLPGVQTAPPSESRNLFLVGSLTQDSTGSGRRKMKSKLRK